MAEVPLPSGLYYLYLSSDDPSNAATSPHGPYQDNSQFTVQLARPLRMAGSWEVYLKSISLMFGNPAETPLPYDEQSLFVNLDVVAPQIVGSQQTNTLMRFTPPATVLGTGQRYHYDNQDADNGCRVNTQRLERLTVSITDATGEQIQLAGPTPATGRAGYPTVIVLAFRQLHG